MQKERLLVLFSFIAIAFVAYRNCFDIFIPGDNYSLFYIIETEGLIGGINHLGAYLFSLPVIFLFYKLAGDSSSLWIALSLILHGLNAYLVYRFASKCISYLFEKQINLPGIFSGIFFLVSPYQTEAILWTPADLPILIATLLSIGSLLILLHYLDSGQKHTLYFFHVVFLFAVFSYESSFVLPGISLLLYALYKITRKTELSLLQFVVRILLPQAGIIFLYFIATKIIAGEWIWHGKEFGWSLAFSTLTGNMLKYLAKFLFFFRYIPFGSMDGLLREAFNHPGYVLLFFLLISALLIVCFFLLVKQKKKEGLFISVLFLCFIISLSPVLPLDSSFLKYIYPDRYGYLPSVFFYIFLVSAIYFFLNKIAFPVLIGYTFLCWMLLIQTIAVWSAANEHCNTLTLNYKPFLPYDRIYVLNVPTYYKGVAAFRSAFAETIFMKNDVPEEKIRIISGCYQDSETDTLTSVIMQANRVTVSGPKNETSYFSTDGGWAKSYETNEYKVLFDSTGCSYTLLFKQKIPANSAFIYTSFGTWKKAG